MTWKEEKISDKYYTQNSYTGETIDETKIRLESKRLRRINKKSTMKGKL